LVDQGKHLRQYLQELRVRFLASEHNRSRPQASALAVLPAPLAGVELESGLQLGEPVLGHRGIREHRSEGLALDLLLADPHLDLAGLAMDRLSGAPR
jgi:hypothetical protein